MVSGLMAEPATAGTAKKPAAAAAPAAAASQGRAETGKPPAAEPVAKKPADAKAASQDSAAEFKRFLVMLKAGGYSPQNVDDFQIADIPNATVYSISDDITPQLGVESAIRFNRWIGLYGNFDAVFLDGISWYNLSAGPLLTVQAGEGVMPYLKGGAVYGNFSWSDAPGSFDSSVGWEAGVGINVLKSNIKIGLDFNYRDISFDYEAPAGVTATEEALDMGGYSLMGTVSFWF
jgi:opacity protein-like surface antigen